MAIYTYQIPYQLMLLHHLTGKVASLEYLEITVGSQCIGRASNGAVAGVLKETFKPDQALQPVQTIYIDKKSAKGIHKKKGKLLFILNTNGPMELFDSDGIPIPFLTELDCPVLVNYEDLFPENEGIRSFAKFPLYAVNRMASVLRGLNEQHINFTFYEEGDPAVSEYDNGNIKASFVTVMA